MVSVVRKPNGGKGFRGVAQAAQAAGENFLESGLLCAEGVYPQTMRLDRRVKHRLNGGFCDARQGSARLFASGAVPGCVPARLIRSGSSIQTPGSRQRPRLEQLSARRSAWAVSLTNRHQVWPAPGPARAATSAPINQRVHHETYLSTFRYPSQAHPRFPCPHEDPRWPCRAERTPRQGPQAPGHLRLPRRAVA